MAAPESAPSNRRRAPGEVRKLLVAAAVEMARAGGPDAVVLREATRRAGVVPNAAYKHFADRDELLNAVCVSAMRSLAGRMETAVEAVTGRTGSKPAASHRLDALGRAYVSFAIEEPGLFTTAFAVPRHLEYAQSTETAGAGGLTPFEMLSHCLDDAREAGLVSVARRSGAEFSVWSAVHGLAVLLTQGPLREVPSEVRERLIESLIAFIRRAL